MARGRWRATARAALNIANTIIGGGVSLVPLPYAVRQVGMPCALVMLPLIGLWATYAGIALLRVSSTVGSGTYEGCARATLGGTGSRLTRVFISLNGFGCCVSLLDVWGDVAPESLPHAHRDECLLLAAAALWPLVGLVRDIGRLAPLSLFASICCVLFLANAIATAVEGPLDGLDSVTAPPKGAGTPKVLLVLLHTFSVGVFSFVGHFNILPVYRSLARSMIAPTDATAHADADAGHADDGALDDDDAAPQPTDHPAGDQSADRAERSAIASAVPRRAMGAALIVAFAVAFTVYATLGVLGALTFGPDTSDDALADYSRTPFGRACRFMLAAAMLATYPLFSHEPLVFLRQLHAYTVRHVSRHVSNALHRSTGDRDDASPAPLGTPTAALLEPPRGRSRPRGDLGEQSTAASIIGGALWVGATAAGALLAADAGKVLALVGAVCATPLMCVLPPLMHGVCLPRGGARSASLALAGLGAAASVACTAAAIHAFFE